MGGVRAENGSVSTRSIGLSETLHTYLLDHALREPPLLARLREETARLPHARMQISPEQGCFMALLVELMGVRRALEIGVFTGYSSTSVALALPEDGRLVACDSSAEWTTIARRYWADANVTHKIDLRLGPARDTLAALLAAGNQATFDFAFVDADKENYLHYYDACLALVRPGGLIAFDNALWSGRIADETNTEPTTQAIRAVLQRAQQDAQVTPSLLPIGDGLLLLRKRGSPAD